MILAGDLDGDNDKVKGCSDPYHFIFEIYVGKRRTVRRGPDIERL